MSPTPSQTIALTSASTLDLSVIEAERHQFRHVECECTEGLTVRIRVRGVNVDIGPAEVMLELALCGLCRPDFSLQLAEGGRAYLRHELAAMGRDGIAFFEAIRPQLEKMAAAARRGERIPGEVAVVERSLLRKLVGRQAAVRRFKARSRPRPMRPRDLPAY